MYATEWMVESFALFLSVFISTWLCRIENELYWIIFLFTVCWSGMLMRKVYFYFLYFVLFIFPKHKSCYTLLFFFLRQFFYFKFSLNSNLIPNIYGVSSNNTFTLKKRWGVCNVRMYDGEYTSLMPFCISVVICWSSN